MKNESKYREYLNKRFMQGRYTVKDTIDELYMLAEQEGIVINEKQEFIEQYTGYRNLKLKYDKALEIYSTSIPRSKLEKKETKKQRKEAKKEIKELEKEIKKRWKILKPMMEQFDFLGIGQAKSMLILAEFDERELKKEKEREERIAKIFQKEKVVTINSNMRLNSKGKEYNVKECENEIGEK